MTVRSSLKSWQVMRERKRTFCTSRGGDLTCCKEGKKKQKSLSYYQVNKSVISLEFKEQNIDQFSSRCVQIKLRTRKSGLKVCLKGGRVKAFFCSSACLRILNATVCRDTPPTLAQGFLTMNVQKKM